MMSTGATTVTRDLAAQDYLDGVAAELADLPEEDRADLLDELAAHVDELVAEGDAPLTARLGSPAEYAAELRASAGLPPAGSRGRLRAQVLGRLRSRRADPSVVAVEEFVGSLRPAWWLIRAWVVVALATWYAHPHWWRSLVLVPDMGPDALSVVVLVLALMASVQTGRHGRFRSVTAAWLVAGLNLVAVLGIWPVLLTLNEAVQYGAYNGYGYRTVVHSAIPREGVYGSGHQITNLFAYDSAGRAIVDVRLYDQRGLPVDVGVDPATREAVVDADGRAVSNAYPYRYLDGTLVDPAAKGSASLVVPPLAAAPSPSPSATPSPSASPTSGKR
jgi:hypothetical protein